MELTFNNRKVLKVWWYNVTHSVIGVVKYQDSYSHEKKYVIGIGRGKDEVEDIKSILMFGAKYNPAEVE